MPRAWLAQSGTGRDGASDLVGGFAQLPQCRATRRSEHTHPGVWNWGVLWLLQLPAWALFGLLGLILAFLGRRRRRVNIYAN